MQNRLEIIIKFMRKIRPKSISNQDNTIDALEMAVFLLVGILKLVLMIIIYEFGIELD